MKNKTKISVILCVYNAQDYIEECLLSLKEQNEKNFEVIIINDGSNDNSENIIFECVNNYNLDAKYIYQENIGLTKSLNKAIDLCSGEYIARMDADDISLPDRFNDSLKFLKENDLDILTTKSERFSESGEVSFIPSINNNKISFGKNYLKFGNPFIHGTFFGKREVFESLKYNEDFRTAQDFDFLCRVVFSSYKLGYLNKVLYKLRIDNQSSGRKPSSNQSKNAISIVRKHFGTDKFLLIKYKGVVRALLVLFKRMKYEW
ncbi:hypothetical protein C0W80_17890 [Photobacterium leiognathi subsp. mandapamensis]|uniref:glycosyltransferase family 2 protein n=1 Tax=Photobacterium leiognathi TaxID=553611 RepID=UPI000D17BE58|nr:glycosyltransferase [Photobacterium leiognathi]PSU95985.1 hypothetical protein C0W80_17890 [Photobacterium leiognathi subsp. mandapamensis]